MICLADLTMWVRKEYSPCDLFWGIAIISRSISGEETGLKKKEQAEFTWGRYSGKCWNGCDILEAKLYPTEEKYLFIKSWNFEELWDTCLVRGHFKEVITLWALCFQPKKLLMPSHTFLVLFKFSSKYLWKYIFLLIRVTYDRSCRHQCRPK